MPNSVNLQYSMLWLGIRLLKILCFSRKSDSVKMYVDSYDIEC